MKKCVGVQFSFNYKRDFETKPKRIATIIAKCKELMHTIFTFFISSAIVNPLLRAFSNALTATIDRLTVEANFLGSSPKLLNIL